MARNDPRGTGKFGVAIGRPLELIKNAADSLGARVGMRAAASDEGAVPSVACEDGATEACISASDAPLLGVVRDHTDLFTRLRATASYIRETEAAARAEEQGAGGASAAVSGHAAGRSAAKDPALRFFYNTGASFKRTLGSRRRDPSSSGSSHSDAASNGPTASFAAVCAAAETLARVKRKIEGALMPQYLAFVASLRESADTTAAASDAETDARQSNVETHLATLLLVEAELQAALKQLKVSHAQCAAIKTAPGDPEEALVKRNVANAHSIARTDLTARFKRARDSVSEMLRGNAAAKVVSQQRALRAADAAYDELERFYAALVRLRAECVVHPAMLRVEGAAVIKALTEAAEATKHALRAAYEESTLVKKGEGSGITGSSARGSDGMEESWRAHYTALAEELTRSTQYGYQYGEEATTAAPRRGHAAAAPTAILPRWQHDTSPEDVAGAAKEHVRHALRGAVDVIEDAVRACAAATSHGHGVGTPPGMAPSTGVGFRRTMTALVPVKERTVVLFRALDGLAEAGPPCGRRTNRSGGVGGREAVGATAGWWASSSREGSGAAVIGMRRSDGDDGVDEGGTGSRIPAQGGDEGGKKKLSTSSMFGKMKTFIDNAAVKMGKKPPPRDRTRYDEIANKHRNR